MSEMLTRQQKPKEIFIHLSHPGVLRKGEFPTLFLLLHYLILGLRFSSTAQACSVLIRELWGGWKRMVLGRVFHPS